MKEVTFTAAQLDAVDVSRRSVDACVVAGPGSGKTTVLVEYCRRLVEAGVDPLRILAITFTEKAAANMRKKLAEAFGSDAAIRARLERAWVSTVHGFCARLLRDYAVAAGIDPEFAVADERQAWLMQQQVIAEAVEQLFQERPEAVRDLIRGLASAEFESALLSAYDAMRGAGVSVNELGRFFRPRGRTMQEVALTLDQLSEDPAEGWSVSQRQHLAAALESAERVISAPGPGIALREIGCFSLSLTKCKRGTPAYELARRLREELNELKYELITQLYEGERETLFELLRRFDRLYRERKRLAGLLDFSDLEEHAVSLLKNPEARAAIQAQFDHILMDEFQDTNGQQSQLLELLRTPGRFYAVGDVNQSIFGFRHAEPEVFQEYRDRVEADSARLVDLAENFRSRPHILRAVETVTAGEPGIEPRRLTPARKFEHERLLCVEFADLADEEDGARALRNEARWVASRVQDLARDPQIAGPESAHPCFGKIALLVRNTEVVPEFTAAFEQAGIPYVVTRGRGFYDSPEVCDLANLLRAIANPRDEIAVAAVMRSPLVGSGSEALLELRLMGGNFSSALARIANQPELTTRPEVRRFATRLKEWRARREYVSFDRLLQEALDESAYVPESGARGEANIGKFLALARQASASMSLDRFVAELLDLRENNPQEPDAPPEDSSNAVTVMTVHSAKGLEYPVVFLAAMHKGVAGRLPVIAFSRTLGLGVRWRDPADRKEKADLYHHAISQERQRREERESNRLLYVAMTRAEEHLVMSYSSTGADNWAALVAGKFQTAEDGVQDAVEARVSPFGEEWKLRIVRRPAMELAGGSSASPAEARAFLSPRDPSIAIAGQQDGNATVTELSDFAKCPRLYYLSHYLGYEPARAGSSERDISAAELGSQVHALLSGEGVPNPHPEALSLAEVFKTSQLGRRAERAANARREFDFLMAVDDLVIRGKVDLWFEEAGGIVIVDYKTDDVTRAQAHERAADYALQVRLYAKALERATGKTASRACLYFLRPNVAVDVDLTPSLLDSPEQVIRDFQQAQETLAFPMNTSAHCQRCAYARDLCPAST